MNLFSALIIGWKMKLIIVLIIGCYTEPVIVIIWVLHGTSYCSYHRGVTRNQLLFL